MTFEKKCLIETGDILSVQYECGNCHAAIVIPVERLDPERSASIAMSACAHCGTPSGFGMSTQEIKAFLAFNSSLRGIAEAMKGRNLRLRLSIKCAE
jgi:hypothetical protein